MVGALDRKLLRDLRRMWGQVLTIALVVACGIAAFVTMRSALSSLERSRDLYYDRYRFADVFASIKRGPEVLKARIEELPGVAMAQTRIVENVRLMTQNDAEPPRGRLVSLDLQDAARLNDVYLRRGRMVDPDHPDEALLIEGFADAQGIGPGDFVTAVINGAQRDLRVVGIAVSPEYVFATDSTLAFASASSFPVLWMPRRAIAAAFDLEGAFNSVCVRLQPGASQVAVVDRLDSLLERYGSRGAYGRDQQPSHRILSNEMQMLGTLSTFIPAIFLGVAAFLLSVVLGRVIQLQRGQIAIIKAVGYTNREVGLHYLKLVAVIVTLGTVLGIGLGAWLGRELTEVYRAYAFKFPVLDYRLEAGTAATGWLVSLGAALLGALRTVRWVTRLPPAEAMQPPKPVRYHGGLLARLGLHRWFTHVGRIVFREFTRRPLRLALSSLGIAMALSTLIVGRFFYDSVTYLMDVQFQKAMREDLTVTFTDPMDERAVRSLGSLPGVLLAEPVYAFGVRIEAKSRERETVLYGHEENAKLRRILSPTAQPIALRAGGVALTAKLADLMDVRIGDRVRIARLDGDQQLRAARVTQLVSEPLGLQVRMLKEEAIELFGDSRIASGALLSVDPAAMSDVRERLQEMPRVLDIGSPMTMRKGFQEESENWIRVMSGILALFAATIAFGVVYNNARVSLSTRNRDLASLRVIGFTRGEISSILLSELAVQVVLAIPLGLALGTWMAHGIASTIDPENYRIEPMISLRTYGFAVAVVSVASAVSALWVRRQLDRLDLIGVLKVRE